MTESSLALVKLLVVFLAILSLASLEGPFSTNFHLPTVPLGRAILPPCQVTIGTVCAEYWIPAGASEDTLSAIIFTTLKSSSCLPTTSGAATSTLVMLPVAYTYVRVSITCSILQSLLPTSQVSSAKP